jgi:hypothetical protein
VKLAFNWGSILVRKGFTPLDTVWAKYLGES